MSQPETPKPLNPKPHKTNLRPSPLSLLSPMNLQVFYRLDVMLAPNIDHPFAQTHSPLGV